jgi:hypothetical protein
MQKIKILFYTFFVFDVFGGCVVGVCSNVVAGVLTAVVLLSLNVTGYVVILKIKKVGESGTK